MGIDTYYSHMGVRLSADMKRQFLQKAAKYGGQSEVLRELIHAFIENRITIAPPEPKKLIKELSK